MEGNSSPNLVDEKFVKRADSLSENHNGGSLHLSGTPKPYQAPWSSPKLSDNFGLYSGNLSSSPLMGKQLKWNGYQVLLAFAESEFSFHFNSLQLLLVVCSLHLKLLMWASFAGSNLVLGAFDTEFGISFPFPLTY